MTKIKSVKTVILNIQCGDWRFEDLTLMLDGRLTVFTGAMGSGKTSIIEALATTIYAEKYIPWVFTNYVTYRRRSVDISDVSHFAIIGSLSVDISKPFTAYSKGEQAIIGLYWSIANKLKFLDANDRLLVLIDDLGHDLHPIWQHKILPCLLKDFPTVQFVMTTTSPLVLTHVQPDSLFFIERKDQKIEIWQATESYGKTSERILEDLQGLKTTRPIEMEECLQRVYQCLDSSDLASATKELIRAKEMMANARDPELTRMELRLSAMHRNHTRDFESHPNYGLIAELKQRKTSLENEINYNYTLGK